ncbi:TonB-dependent receptor [uncultured Oxalicibacterium sp.]|uniref:TonB-dependent receptor domain-containing protein n=1 Tax=uncultured Oxalicibacterium sp. TaxID=1168540 RepID=UPI0025FA4397|nr:TonB-dependent receptor [uncultured Oxalicibacterium sp.]
MYLRKHLTIQRTLSPLALSLHLLFAAGSFTLQADALAQTRSYSIPAGPLDATLNRFAQEAGIAIVIDARKVANLQSPGLQGPHDVDAGFAELLRGSGYSASKTAAGYVLTPSATPVTRPAVSKQDDDAVMQAIVVTASRSNMEAEKAPQTVQIIEKAEIEQQMTLSTNTSDVLSNLIPSYSPSRGKMTGSGETMRGRTPLILIDGVPQSNPLRPTGREVHTIDFAMVERIEVIQGANAINGLGATGGTINIITKRPAKGSFNQHVDVQTTMPTSNIDSEVMNYKTTYRADGRLDKLDYLFSVGYENQGLYRDGAGRAIGVDNTQGDLMDSRMVDFLGKIGYWIDDEQRLQFSLNRYQLKSKGSYLSVNGNRAQGIPTTSVKGTPPGTVPWNDVWTSAVTYDHYNLAGMELSAMAFHQKFEGLFGATNSENFQDISIAPDGTLYDQTRSAATKYGSKVNLTKSDLVDGRLKVTAGFDTLFDQGKQDLYGTGRTYVPESKYNNISLFTQAEFQLLDRLKIHAGVRREKADLRIDTYRTVAANNGVTVEGGKLKFNETLYNIGLVATPTDSLTLFSSYSEGFGMPDVGRVLRGIDTPGQSVSSLNTLSPVLTKSKEFGARYKKGPWDMEASVFESTSPLGTRVESVNGVYILAREATRIRGFDLNAGYRINKIHQARLGYSQTSGRYDSNGDGTLDRKLDGANIAPTRVILSWNANWNEKMSSFVQAQHAFTQSFNTPATHFKGYTLVDASMRYKLQKGTLRFGVANLFNQNYITYYSQSGQVDNARYFAGRGRTLTIGYALDF